MERKIRMPASPSPVELPLLVRSMLRPAFYPHKPGSVTLVQTHISWVFLAGDRVYKVKKPLNLGFLDYSSLSRRRKACEKEVLLNRRLSPQVYLGAVPVYQQGDLFRLSPPGRIAEYAVVMRRLPAGRFLSTLMAQGKATLAQIRQVAQRIALFHAEAQPALPGMQRISVLEKNLRENFRQTLPYLGRTVREQDYLIVWDYNRKFLKRRRSLLNKRIVDGRLRDGHGDLHAEHICLDNGVQIYDCIEFSPRIRQGDVAADVAFLYMDLLYHRHPVLARAFMEEYLRRTGDWELRLLVPFYACYRAVVREKVESFRIADPSIARREKTAAARRAGQYFSLARSLAEADSRPRLILIGGLPGTGKSTVARMIANRLGADYLNSDIVRKELAGLEPGTAAPASFKSGIYSARVTKLTYDELFAQAEQSLLAGRSMVLDATFSRGTWRRRGRSLARRLKALAVMVECHCPPGVVRARLKARRISGGVSDAGWEIYKALKRNYERPDADTVRVDTTEPLEKGLAKIAEAAYPF
ncbi:MAG: bifunctional aminoglycoside phosphotransferase/ATP-binding protein [Thermodesulfovibrionales bacterium]